LKTAAADGECSRQLLAAQQQARQQASRLSGLKERGALLEQGELDLANLRVDAAQQALEKAALILTQPILKLRWYAATVKRVSFGSGLYIRNNACPS
jgi:hypothetical protein